MSFPIPQCHFLLPLWLRVRPAEVGVVGAVADRFHHLLEFA